MIFSAAALAVCTTDRFARYDREGLHHVDHFL